jgi:dihydroorotate dehydrogenase (fumarate)
MGLQLKNPVIASSSGLTDSVEKVHELERYGVGAVVLKSLFEEQIMAGIEGRTGVTADDPGYSEVGEYIKTHGRHHVREEYLKLIRDCKRTVSIPVIASINCISVSEWINFAADIEHAGADAIELNLFALPSDPLRTHAQNEELYLHIVQQVVRKAKIPVALKLSPYYTGLANSFMKFSWTGIKGMVLFNRFFSPDIDIERLEIIPGALYSSPQELSLPLRWTALLSDRISCDIAASTGIHDAESMIKLLLAGARAVQICSLLYLKGPGEIGVLLNGLETYMDRHDFNSVTSFIGKMSVRTIENPAAYERVQFMKFFSGFENHL